MTTTDTRETAAAAEPLPSDADRSGRWLGEEELSLLRQVIESGTLTSTKGTMVKRLETEFAEKYGMEHCIATSSGSAAVHAALAALDLQPGDEVVTTPITDMGGITPIFYEGAVPVFADVDPDTGNLTAETLERAITPRTRAVVLVHLFGNPCDMGPITHLLQKLGIALVEDCAQAFFAEWGGRRVGSFGEVAAFSLQQGKHMTCGEGGLVLSDDSARARRARLFVNKAWPYGEANPDHEFVALNYRLSELQGAVALAQLGKVDRVLERRRETARLLSEMLADLPGVVLPRAPEGGLHSFWRYALMVEPTEARDVAAVGARLQAEGIACAPRYIQKPAFECRVLRERLGGVPPQERFVGAYRMLERVLVLPWNESYETRHVERIAGALRGALG